MGQNVGAKLGKIVLEIRCEIGQKRCKFGQSLGAKLGNKCRLQKGAILGKIGAKLDIGPAVLLVICY